MGVGLGAPMDIGMAMGMGVVAADVVDTDELVLDGDASDTGDDGAGGSGRAVFDMSGMLNELMRAR